LIAVGDLIALQGIRELLHRRGRAADAKSPEAIVAQHVPGSKDRHGIFDGTIEEFADYLRTHNYQDERYGLQRHTLGNMMAEFLTPDLARVETYHLAYHRLNLHNVAFDVDIGGRYLDICERLRGRWLIRSRAVVYDWSTSAGVTVQAPGEARARQPQLGADMPDLPSAAPAPAGLADLLAKQEITEVLYRRARAGDRRDVDLALSCYHPGATENHEGFDGTAAEFIGDVSMISPSSTAPVTTLWHFISNVLIDLQSDEAVVESYHIAVVVRRDDGADTHSRIGGRYLDRFAHRDGVWAITHRDVVFDWSRVEEASATYWGLMGMDETKLLRGTFGADDPLYSELGVARG
jgi:hypothetical protein